MEWISVKDRLPNENEMVLVSEGKFTTFSVFRKNGFMFVHMPYINKVLYWMPLPEPPKIKGENK